MKDESLADRAPWLRECSEEEQSHNDGNEQHQSNECIERVDEETHHQAANQAQSTRVPAEVVECRPVDRNT